MGREVVDSDEEVEMEDDERAAEKEADDVDSGNDEEEEEEGQDEYEQDGFIVDDVEEEEEEVKQDSDEDMHRRKKKKKRGSEKNFVLDEDDYELLQDNNITGFRRPQPSSKFKRLKKAGKDNEVDNRTMLSDEEEFGLSRRGDRSAEERLKLSLFGDDNVAPLEDVGEEEEQSEEDGNIIGEEDEMADFIVDEEDIDETGAFVRKKKLKKKKPRQALGVSSSALQEAHDIFGDVDELLKLRKYTLASAGGDSPGEKRLEDDFEPFIVSEKYMTPKDEIIRETDVPERIQLFEDITGPPPLDDSSIEEESTWIFNQLNGGGISPLVGYDDIVKEINKEEVGNVLTMMHVQKLDIPFISMYRKELCGSLLKDLDDNMQDEEIRKMKWHKLLWAVQTLDSKWLLLQKRKSALHSYYDKCFEDEVIRVYDEAKLTLNRQIFKSVIAALNDAKSEREVDDIDAKFNLHFPPGEVDTEHGQFKRPKRKSLYTICHKAGLWEIAIKFGVNSEQFGSLLLLEKIKDEVEDRKETPEEIAANFTCSMFETPQDVLKGARHMAAVEIGCEPNVKKHVRNIFMEKAVVSTSPTPEGNLAIDTYHQLAGVKWLRDKPLSEFVDAQWLLIQKGEEDKLLQVTIKLPEVIQKKLLSSASDCYLSDFVSKSAQTWNEQRRMILEDSFLNFIFPSTGKEARSLLTARAKSWLRMEYGRQLWNKVSIAPFKRKDAANDSEDGCEARVMACCWGPGKPATTIVMLDSTGELLDVLYAGSISVRSLGVADQQRKRHDHQRVLKFMTDHQPHAVCLGAANMACRQLKDDIYEVIFKIVEDHPKDVAQDLEHMTIVFGDESLPHLYENSRISSDQLPGQPGIVKRAVALGRYLQNPLAMVSTLCGPGKEIQSWKLCPLQHFLTLDEKFEVVEQVMVDATNQVGVDVNLAASHDWLFAPLQFVSGLGPRKASALQKAFVRAGSIFNRKEIPMGKILRKKVFINCVGFLRVRRSGAAGNCHQIMDLLDDTRIHPESYELAKSLAKDIYDEDAPNEANDMDDDVLEMAIEHVRENPNMLKVLDIDEYAKSIFNRYKTNKKETLYDIKMELLQGFKDWRSPFTEPDADEEFAMLSGETDDTISEGRIVQVTVRQVQESRIICSFDSGLKGMISSDDFSDEGYDTEKVHVGDILNCKIKHVNKNRLVAYLTSKFSDLRKRPPSIQNHDPYYSEGGIISQNKVEKVRKEKQLAKKHYRPRMIVHPRFQNLSADEAIEYLSDKDPGESILRPSSKGPSFLTLTLKVFDGVYAHKEIVEGGKDHSDITSLLRLGKTLTIDRDTFEDLDEVMDRYVDPLVVHLKSMLAYRKFRKGTKTEVDDQLRAEKAANPMRIVYCFGTSHEYPGTFILSYIRSSNPHHEYIGMCPKGFRFRKKDFDNIDRLVSYFQKNIDKPLLDSSPSIRTLAAVVPMKSPGWVSSDGGSTGSDDGWENHTNLDAGGSSNPGLRTGERYGHPSGIPHPGRGRGRGRGRGNNFGSEDLDSDNGTRKWGSSENDGSNTSPRAKIQNSPGRDTWAGGGEGSGGSWGEYRNKGSNGGNEWGGGYADGGDDKWPGTSRGWSEGGSSGGGSWGSGTDYNAGGSKGKGSVGWVEAGNDSTRPSSGENNSGNDDTGGWGTNGGSGGRSGNNIGGTDGSGDWGSGGDWGEKNSRSNNAVGDWGTGPAAAGDNKWAGAKSDTGLSEGGNKVGNWGVENNAGGVGSKGIGSWGVGNDLTCPGHGGNSNVRGDWDAGRSDTGHGRVGNDRDLSCDGGDWGSGSSAGGGDKWAGSNNKKGPSGGGSGDGRWGGGGDAGGSGDKSSSGRGEVVKDSIGWGGNSSSSGGWASGGNACGWGGDSKGGNDLGSGSAEGFTGKWARSSENKEGWSEAGNFGKGIDNWGGVGNDNNGPGRRGNHGGRGGWSGRGSGRGQGGNSGGRGGWGTGRHGRGRVGNNRVGKNGDWGSDSAAEGGDKWVGSGKQDWRAGSSGDKSSGGWGDAGNDSPGGNCSRGSDKGGWGGGNSGAGTGWGSDNRGDSKSQGDQGSGSAGGNRSKSTGSWEVENDNAGANSSAGGGKGGCGSGSGDSSSWGGNKEGDGKGEGDWGSGSAGSNRGKSSGSWGNDHTGLGLGGNSSVGGAKGGWGSGSSGGDNRGDSKGDGNWGNGSW